MLDAHHEAMPAVGIAFDVPAAAQPGWAAGLDAALQAAVHAVLPLNVSVYWRCLNL